MKKIVIVGCKKLGIAYIYTLLNQKNYIDEIVIINNSNTDIKEEYNDLCNSINYYPNKIKVVIGNFNDCIDADLICITEDFFENSNDKLTNLEKNNKIIKETINNILWNKFKGIFLIATKNVDIITYLTQYYSEFSYNKIIGIGTSIDSSKLQYIIAKKYDININSINTFIMGINGKNMFIPWNNCNIANRNIKDFLNKEEINEIEKQIKNKNKENNFYSKVMCLINLTNSIINNEEKMISVSSYDGYNDIYYSSPCIIGKDGIIEKMHVELGNNDRNRLLESIEKEKKIIKKLTK